MRNSSILRLLLLPILLLTHTVADAQKQGQAYVDSLLTEIPKANNDTNKVNLLRLLSFRYSTIDPTKGLKYGEEGLLLANELGWEKGKGTTHNSIATNYNMLGNYPMALQHLDTSLAINTAVGYQKGVAINLRNMGIIYQKMDDYKPALEKEKASLDIYEKMGDREGIAAIHCNIGGIYLDIAEFGLADSSFSKALAISREIDNKKDIAINLGNRGVVARNLNHPEQSMQYLKEALSINETLGDNYGKIKCYYNLGAVYVVLKKYEEAVASYDMGMKLAGTMNAQDLMNELAGRMGSCYLAVVKDSTYPLRPTGPFAAGRPAQLSQAIRYLNTGLLGSRKMGDPELEMLFTEEAAEAYALAGDYQQAYSLQKYFTRLNKTMQQNILAVYKEGHLDREVQASR